MRKLTFFLCLTGISWLAPAQYNFGFEETDPETGRLKSWNLKSGPSYFGPILHFDKEVKHSGHQSLCIERRATDTATQFTPVSVTIPVDFNGKQITAGGWLKTENVSGYAQFWIRFDDENGKMLRLANHPRSSLKGTSDWMRYDTSFLIPEDAHVMHFGFLVTGRGKVWGDDLALAVDGVPFDKVSRGHKIIFPAARDKKEFIKGSGIHLRSVTPQQTEHLALLGKTWGFLKYFHPFIAKGNLNWDYELFRFLPAYLVIKDKKERNRLLLQWIQQWEKPAACKDCSEKELVKALYKPDLAWLSDRKELGDSLSNMLEYIRQNRHQGNNYYMELYPGVGNPQVMHENPYREFSSPDAGYRLLCLFRYWNLIQYWFPYKHLIGEDWKNVLTEFIPRMVAADDAVSYTITTRQLIARVHDTHANTWGSNNILDSLKGRFYPPVKVSFIGEKAVVSKIIQEELALASGLQPGDIIESIDGKKKKDIIKEKLPDLPASNYSTQLRDLATILLRSNDSTSSMVISRNGKEHVITLVRGNNKKVPRQYDYDFPYQKDSTFFFIRPGIGYLNLGRVQKKQVDSIFNALEGSAGLVIDNRQYPSDFPLYHIAAKLMPRKTPFTKIPGPSLDYPGAFRVIAELSVGEMNRDYYKGRVVILINENTQSSGEFHTMAFEPAPNATVIGSTTAGADGNVSQFYLPGGISTMFSGISILYPDGRETQRTGIVPDIEVKRTPEGIQAGKDELLEKAVDLIRAAGNEQEKNKKGF